MNETSEQVPFWNELEVAIPEHLRGYVDAPTNQIMPSIVRRDVEDVLAAVLQKVDLLDQDISQLHDPSDGQIQLEYREQYAALIDRLKIIIAPHKRLPVEILADIFHFTLPDDFRICVPSTLFYQNYQMKGPVLPWSFGHICSLWRQVALTEHRLWNRIRVGVTDFKPSRKQMLETVLVRSASASLDLDMTVNQCFIPLSNIILPQASRISRLILNVNHFNPTDILRKFSLPGSTLSTLTEAILVADNLEIPGGTIHTFRDCPLLHKLTICLYDHVSGSLEALRGLHIPFSQLTELVLYVHSSPHSVLCILKETVNLVRCTIAFNDPSFIDNLAFDIVLPRLENLSLFSNTLEIMVGVIQHITLPSLLQLYVECPLVWETPEAIPSAVLTLINRSSCRLTHITMEGDLGSIVERSHHSLVSVVTLLYGSLPSLPASMVQQITRREITLPHLEELNCVLNLDTFMDLKKMVEALWSNGEGGGDIRRRVFRSRCKIAGGGVAGEEGFDHWEEEMEALFKRLSIDGSVVFLDGDDG